MSKWISISLFRMTNFMRSVQTNLGIYVTTSMRSNDFEMKTMVRMQGLDPKTIKNSSNNNDMKK